MLCRLVFTNRQCKYLRIVIEWLQDKGGVKNLWIAAARHLRDDRTLFANGYLRSRSLWGFPLPRSSRFPLVKRCYNPSGRILVCRKDEIASYGTSAINKEG
jgi:hypothetical protein